MQLWQQGQAAVRSLCAGGRAAVRYLNKVPWLLARLDQPGVRAQVVRQWAAVPRERHHPLSVFFLDPLESNGLRPDVDLITDDAQNISPRLRTEIGKLQNIPMDDNIGEGPHAKAKQVLSHSTPASFPWMASTCRLEPNLTQTPDLAEASGMDLQTEWDRWSSVVKGHHWYRPSKHPPKKVGCAFSWKHTCNYKQI